MAGVPLKPSSAFAAMFPNARLIVSVAWGADLNADQSTWARTDVTTFLSQANGQTISIDPIGKADEYSKSQPARCTLMFNNPNGEFSKGPQSSNWPFVRANVPIIVEITLDGVTRFTRFFGYITSLEPHDTTSARTGWVIVTAYGKMHLLELGDEPVTNLLTRYHLLAGAAAVWPFDDGTGSTQAANAVPGGVPMAIGGFVSAFGDPLVLFGFKAGDSLPAVDVAVAMNAAPTIDSDVFKSVVNMPVSGNLTIDLWRLHAAEPDASETQLLVCDLLDPSGFFSTIEIRARMSQASPAVVAAYVVRLPSGQVLDSASNPVVNPFDDKWHNVFLKFTQSGGNVFAELWADGNAVASTTFTTKTLPSVLLAVHVRNRVVAGAGTGNADMQSVLAINTTAGTTPSWSVAQTRYFDENVGARLARLSAEEGDGLPIAQRGTANAHMGVQKAATLPNLLREPESAEPGSTLYDGVGQGLTIVWRSAKYGQAPAFVLDAAAGEVAPPFEPKDDDLLDRNVWTIGRRDGSTIIVTDKTGPKGTDAVGQKPGSVTDLSLRDDSRLAGIGAFLLGLGTVDEPYRYPKLVLNLAAIPAKAPAWAATLIGNRIDIANLRTVSTRHPPGDVSLLLEGYGETLSPRQWRVVANCTPYAPWDADALGSSFRLDLAGVTLAAPLAPGATSFTVTIGAGHLPLSLKATYPADYPSDLKVGGWPVHVTDCTGAAPTQTLTCTATPNTNTIPAGTSVTLWRPGRLAY